MKPLVVSGICTLAFLAVILLTDGFPASELEESPDHSNDEVSPHSDGFRDKRYGRTHRNKKTSNSGENEGGRHRKKKNKPSVNKSSVNKSSSLASSRGSKSSSTRKVWNAKLKKFVSSDTYQNSSSTALDTDDYNLEMDKEGNVISGSANSTNDETNDANELHDTIIKQGEAIDLELKGLQHIANKVIGDLEQHADKSVAEKYKNVDVEHKLNVIEENVEKTEELAKESLIEQQAQKISRMSTPMGRSMGPDNCLPIDPSITRGMIAMLEKNIDLSSSLAKKDKLIKELERQLKAEGLQISQGETQFAQQEAIIHSNIVALKEELKALKDQNDDLRRKFELAHNGRERLLYIDLMSQFASKFNASQIQAHQRLQSLLQKLKDSEQKFEAFHQKHQQWIQQWIKNPILSNDLTTHIQDIGNLQRDVAKQEIVKEEQLNELWKNEHAALVNDIVKSIVAAKSDIDIQKPKLQARNFHSRLLLGRNLDKCRTGRVLVEQKFACDMLKEIYKTR